jgi:hypothetical protein
MFRGTMPSFADEAQNKLRAAITRHREAHRIAGPLLRQARASGGVAQIAEFSQLVIAGFGALMAGSAAVAAPTPAQRQASRMKPGVALQFLRGHEKRTRQWMIPRLENCAKRYG